MLCSRARTALSARLDREALPPGVTGRRLDEHLAGCPDCRRWRERAERLGRMPVEPVEPVDEPRPDGDRDAAERLMERIRRPEGDRPGDEPHGSGEFSAGESGAGERDAGGSGRRAC